MCVFKRGASCEAASSVLLPILNQQIHRAGIYNGKYVALYMDPLLTLYIHMEILLCPLALFPLLYPPLPSFSYDLIKFARIAGLLFSDMNVIPDTLGLNCLHFQYCAGHERQKGGQGR